MVFERGRWFLVILVVCVCAEEPAPGAVRPQCPPPPASCIYSESSRDEYFYTVREREIRIKFAATKYFNINCIPNLSLEDSSLPRFNVNVSVAQVTLYECVPPESGYARALAALGVVHFKHLVLDGTPAALPLRAAHFASLPALRTLYVFLSTLAAPPEPTFFSPLAGLRELRLRRVPLPPAALAALPPTLRSLHLFECRLKALPAAALARLPALAVLDLYDSELRAPPELAAAPALRDASLSLPLAQPPSLVRLENLTLWNVSLWELRSEMWGECIELRRLTVAASSRLALPADWLANCTRLERFELKQTLLVNGTLPARLLGGTHALRSLTVRGCGLVALPRDVLANAVELTDLNLSHNRLKDLPSLMFFNASALQTLDLSYNDLSARTLTALAPLVHLRTLVLDYNKLGDLCPAGSGSVYAADADSPLEGLRELRRLSLMRTGVARVCADWRRSLHKLTELDLSHNNITELRLHDLHFELKHAARVDLRVNPLRTLQYSRDDYTAVRAGFALDQQVRLILDAELNCNCDTYWAARALREQPTHALLPGLRCAGEPPRTLATAQLERMTCPLSNEDCAPGCACVWHVDLGVIADCANAGLERVPRAPQAAKPFAQLHLERNHIRELRPDDIDNRTLFVDLSYNELSHISVEAMRALILGERHVLLSGNPLACACADLAALDVLHSARSHVDDYDKLTCDSGVRLRDAEPCRTRDLLVPLAGVAVASLIALAVGVLCWQRRSALLVRLKAALLARGLCLCWLPRPSAADSATADEDKKYDVFVSFSHHDERFVSSQLVARLESGARPLRVCVHYRDWAPGGWIPEQIAASVRDSRRTVLVVSEHFAASPWARAEFHEAHANALRGAVAPVVVLLPGVRREALDPALRAYLTANTYVEWGDQWFWDKLYRALPKPRAAAAPVHVVADDTRKAAELALNVRALQTLAEPAAPCA